MEKLLDDRNKARLMTQRILYLALMSSNAMFAGLAFMAPPHDRPPNDVLLYALVAVGLVVLVVSVVLPMSFENRALASIGGIVERAATDPNLPSSFAKHGKVRVFANPAAAVGEALEKTTTPFILRMALREAVGIYGLVLVYMGYPLVYGLPFMAISALTQSIELPGIARTADALERATGASLGPR